MFDEHARYGEKVVYNVSNPHPLHGKDPNIINEFGHTNYPKFVDHPTDTRTDVTTTHLGAGQSRTNVIETKHPLRVLVQDADEEAELMGTAKPKKGEAGWGGK